MQSEEIVVSAPFSFHGSAARIWKITRTDNQLIKWLLFVPLAIMLISIAWCFVAMWYLIFGIWLIPYRLIRRSSRKNKRDQLRHREILENLEKRQN
jgi:uncharacterized membrane-anchored protein